MKSNRPTSKRERQLWDAATIVTEKCTISTIGTRYTTKKVRLTLTQSVRKWLVGLKRLEWNWSRTGLVMQPVNPGEPGYDDAPYEMGVVWHRDTTTLRP